jgi:hypothetical protein
MFSGKLSTSELSLRAHSVGQFWFHGLKSRLVAFTDDEVDAIYHHLVARWKVIGKQSAPSDR